MTVYLLDLTIAGRTFRLSSRRGSWRGYSYQGGLSRVSVEDSIGGLAEGPELMSVALEVQVRHLDLHAWLGGGGDLQLGTAALYRVRPDGTGTVPVLEGNLSRPNYGREQGRLAFTLEERPFDDRGQVPPTWAAFDASRWADWPVPVASSVREDDSGRMVPLVFGQPGVWRDQGTIRYVRASPCVVLTRDNFTDAVTGVLVACHLVPATAPDGSTNRVRIYDDSGQYVTAPAYATTDDQGRPFTWVPTDVSRADVTDSGSFDATGSSFWCSWVTWRALDIGGAGDLLLELMQRSTVPVDWGRARAIRQQLNRYKTDGYIDSPTTPYDWVVDQLLPMMPISLRSGPSGLYPLLWPWDGDGGDVHMTLTEQAGFVLDGDVEQVTDAGELVNEVQVRFALNARDREYRATATLSPKPASSDPLAWSTTFSRVSASRHGIRTNTVDLPFVYDAPTARRVPRWQVRVNGFGRRELTYVGRTELLDVVRAGMAVRLVAPSLSMDRRCIVFRRTDEDTGVTALRLGLIGP